MLPAHNIRDIVLLGSSGGNKMTLLLTAALSVIVSKYSNGICNTSSIFNGSWNTRVSFRNEIQAYEYNDNPPKEIPFSHCEKTYKSVVEHPVETVRHQAGYGRCAVSPSSYEPFACSVLKLGESVTILREYFNRKNGNNAPLKIDIVGDSLGSQLDIGTRCILERLKIDNVATAEYHRDVYLRQDFPCSPGCSNMTYAKTDTILCYACRDGVQKPLSIETSWHQLIKNDSNIVILNTGAWYNSHLLGLDSDFELEYEKTVRFAVKISDLLAERNIVVLWTPLPPMPKNFGKKYAWDKFEARNQWTKALLAGSSILYMDVNPLIESLQKANPSVDYKGRFHFCSPTPSSVLTVMLETMLSLLCSTLSFKGSL